MPDIATETVTYEAGGATCKGFLAHDDTAKEPRPGVLVVHEWWGLNDYIRERTRQLAALGYVALAVDMYGDGKTAETPDDAGALMNASLGDRASLEARFAAARDLLAVHPGCDRSRIAAVGYCYGGAVVLHAARLGMDLKAVVSFHGALSSMHRPQPGEVKAKVLVCHGAADAMVGADQVAAIRQEMADAGADFRFEEYAGALHGFTNPEATANGEKYGLPLGYDEAADKASWAAMQRLFDEVF